MPRLLVPVERAGSRCDALLHELVPQLSRHEARRFTEIGALARNGVRALAAERVRTGDVLSVPDTAFASSLALGMPVVHEDADLLVLYKLPGLAVHRGPLVDDSVAERLAAAFPGAGLAQRLDRGASGLLLVGKHKEALRSLGQAMESDRIARRYLAIGCGEADFDQRTIDLPLHATDEPRGDQPKVVVDHAQGQPARTHLRVLARRRGASLFAVELETGRTHQIRAHLRAIGHALLGDPRYGDAASNAKAHATHGIARPLLHGLELGITREDATPPLVVRGWVEPDFARLFAEAASVATRDTGSTPA